jgi:hypothetical protein
MVVRTVSEAEATRTAKSVVINKCQAMKTELT